MAEGGKIADFFAQVGFKIETKELGKVGTLLKKFEANLNQVGKTAAVAGEKIEKALSGAARERSKFGIQKKIDLFKKLGGEVDTFQRKLNPTTKKSSLDALNLALDKAIHKQRQLSSGRVSPSKPKDDGKFTQAGFFSKEGNIRSQLKLLPIQKQKVEELAVAFEKEGMSRAQANARIKEAIADMKRHNKQIEIAERKAKKLSFANQRLVSSAKQLAGSYIGVFAAMRAVGQIKEIGQNLESAEAGMLSVTESSATLAKDLAFVDKQAVRLGLDLVQTTKGFVKLKASSRGMKEEDLQGVFLGIAESGTVMQLSQDDIAGSIRAVQQMMTRMLVM